MQPGRPSLTALSAAHLRAAHQVLDGACILADPLAARILGPDARFSLDYARLSALVSRAELSGPLLRWFIAARSRIAEDALHTAISNGATQLVVLGAGFDTLPYRMPRLSNIRIFEVDHPATQARKRERLAMAAIEVPETLSYVAMDLEEQTLAAPLQSAGFEAAERSFFSCLGVVPYLTEQAIFAIFDYVAQLRGGAEVVFDYVCSTGSLRPTTCAPPRAIAEAPATGQQIRSYLDTADLCSKLSMTGFRTVENMGPEQIAARLFPDAGRGGSLSGCHIMRAATG
ncbi:class I SAM-dependent methyltransferase [Bradyrhizobium sp. Arg68]|uniref:class I SAM-dependent methyltransferase n=1 Tax=Bradyrhizobium ivorense TaxID=2511166 RepID=UPI001E600960|nr:class I SAM-dependent methyltransferase [Bradyrhizobium ivorense]MCC8936295.1 class I SAM-dependent methyltransferase [Bradyrhizobium ivorense]